MGRRPLSIIKKFLAFSFLFALAYKVISFLSNLEFINKKLGMTLPELNVPTFIFIVLGGIGVLLLFSDKISLFAKPTALNLKVWIEPKDSQVKIDYLPLENNAGALTPVARLEGGFKIRFENLTDFPKTYLGEGVILYYLPKITFIPIDLTRAWTRLGEMASRDIKELAIPAHSLSDYYYLRFIATPRSGFGQILVHTPIIRLTFRFSGEETRVIDVYLNWGNIHSGKGDTISRIAGIE